MKKLLRFVTATFTILALTGGAASAQAADCTISGNAAGSDNSCTVNQSQSCTTTNNNDVDVNNDNQQTSSSGSASSSSNGTGGSATSGGASNSNSTSTNVAITNSNGCVAAAPTGGSGGETTPIPTPSTPAAAGGHGAGEVAGASTTLSNVAVLPDTTASSQVPAIGFIAAALGLTAIVSRFGAQLYNRFTN